MASKSKTTNYNLNIWDAGDQVLRADFNEDNSKIDTALFKQRPIVGVFTGNGDAITGQSITLGFEPSVVIVTTKQVTAVTGAGTYAAIGIATPSAPSSHLSTTATGFYASGVLNYNKPENNPFRYIAWR